VDGRRWGTVGGKRRGSVGGRRRGPVVGAQRNGFVGGWRGRDRAGPGRRRAGGTARVRVRRPPPDRRQGRGGRLGGDCGAVRADPPGRRVSRVSAAVVGRRVPLPERARAVRRLLAADMDQRHRAQLSAVSGRVGAVPERARHGRQSDRAAGRADGVVRAPVARVPETGRRAGRGWPRGRVPARARSPVSGGRVPVDRRVRQAVSSRVLRAQRCSLRCRGNFN